MPNQRKLYDLTVLLQNEDDSSVETLLKKAGAESLVKKELTKLELAYPVREKKTAFMGVYAFTLAPEAVKDVLKNLKFDDNCLRQLLLIGKEENQVPAVKAPKPDLKNVPVHKYAEPELLTNEALQRKIEEING